MRKIGIFGGTFNPIHEGHIRLAAAYQKEMQFDKLLLIPTKIPPHKRVHHLASDAHRLEMCRIAAEKYPFLEVSDIEIRRDKKSYTYDTLADLAKEYPDSAFYLIMGSDMFLTFLSWYQAEKMLSMATLLTASRDERDTEALKTEKEKIEAKGGNAMVLGLPVFEVSSTEIRRRIREKENLTGLLDKKVEAYIKKNGLYQKDLSDQEHASINL